jgi:hypothetical protein
MKKIFLILFYCSTSMAQYGSIKGSIYNRIEKNPSTAVIYILGTKLYTQADLNGNFKFEKVKIGNYSLKISDVAIGGNEVFTSIEVSENTTNYLNFIIPRLCKYEDESINHKICPICLTDENIVPVQKYIPHLSVYRKKKEKRKQKKIKYEYEEYSDVEKIYIDCKFQHPYCSPKWYCVKDKVKF